MSIKLTLKNKIVSSLSIFIVILALLAYSLILPAINSIKSIRNEIYKQKIELENQAYANENIGSLNDKIKKIEPQLLNLEKIFANKNRELEFITVFESMAKNNNVEQRLNVSDPQASKSPAYDITPITIEATGQFSDIIRYLADLESLDYYIIIKNISMSKNSVPEKNPTIPQDTISRQIRLSLSADTFWK